MEAGKLSRKTLFLPSSCSIPECSGKWIVRRKTSVYFLHCDRLSGPCSSLQNVEQIKTFSFTSLSKGKLNFDIVVFHFSLLLFSFTPITGHDVKRNECIDWFSCRRCLRLCKVLCLFPKFSFHFSLAFVKIQSRFRLRANESADLYASGARVLFSAFQMELLMSKIFFVLEKRLRFKTFLRETRTKLFSCFLFVDALIENSEHKSSQDKVSCANTTFIKWIRLRRSFPRQ